jgi:hypothetical protein
MVKVPHIKVCGESQEKCAKLIPSFVSSANYDGIVQWNLGLRTQSVPGGGSTFKLLDFRVKFPHLKQCELN